MNSTYWVESHVTYLHLLGGYFFKGKHTLFRSEQKKIAPFTGKIAFISII